MTAWNHVQGSKTCSYLLVFSTCLLPSFSLLRVFLLIFAADWVLESFGSSQSSCMAASGLLVKRGSTRESRHKGGPNYTIKDRTLAPMDS